VNSSLILPGESDLALSANRLLTVEPAKHILRTIVTRRYFGLTWPSAFTYLLRGSLIKDLSDEGINPGTFSQANYEYQHSTKCLLKLPNQSHRYRAVGHLSWPTPLSVRMISHSNWIRKSRPPTNSSTRYMSTTIKLLLHHHHPQSIFLWRAGAQHAEDSWRWFVGSWINCIYIWCEGVRQLYSETWHVMAGPNASHSPRTLLQKGD